MVHDLIESLLWILRRRRRFQIVGASMVPTYADGDEVLVDPRAFGRRSPAPGDVVLASHPTIAATLIVKRIARVEPDGRLYPCTHLVGDFDALDASAGKALDTALRHAASHGCLSCLSSYAQEQNLLFGLSPSAVGSWLRSIAAMLAS